MVSSYRPVLDFWFNELAPDRRFVRDADIDHEIGERFGGLHARAVQCELYPWRTSAHGRLAEVIVLDQFSRNLFRDDARAFAWDPLSLALAQEAIAFGADHELSPVERSFLYMPYMHSESALIHREAMRLFSQEGLEYNLEFEIAHREVIERFGRYPHRNAVLGRESTEEELAFLEEHPSGFRT